MGPEKRPPLLSGRGLVLTLLAAAALASYLALGLDLSGLVPRAGGAEIMRGFFGRALSPALEFEADFVPEGSPHLLLVAAEAAWMTLVLAAAAMGLSLVIGLSLGFCASTAWWAGDPAGGHGARTRALRRTIGPAIYFVTRGLIAFMRSVHEILWAVLFLAALGSSNLTAVIAIAIPYGGTLAKIFSEMADEAPRGPALALRAAGAGDLQVYGFALVPQALPDMIAYAFYRFECALRSSAILGFFGFPTLGLYIRQSFASANYGEVWTHLYVLLALILLFEAWSGAVRRRLTA